MLFSDCLCLFAIIGRKDLEIVLNEADWVFAIDLRPALKIGRCRISRPKLGVPAMVTALERSIGIYKKE